VNNLELMRTLDHSRNAQDWATFEKRHSKDNTVFWPGQAEPTRGRDNRQDDACGPAIRFVYWPAEQSLRVIFSRRILF
jgi:hypothetical protein